MAYSLFFEHTGLNIGSATLLLAMLGLLGCQRKPLFGRSYSVLADSLEQEWDITITLEQGPTRGNELPTQLIML